MRTTGFEDTLKILYMLLVESHFDNSYKHKNTYLETGLVKLDHYITVQLQAQQRLCTVLVDGNFNQPGLVDEA